jgi:hypothetical protein
MNKIALSLFLICVLFLNATKAQDSLKVWRLGTNVSAILFAGEANLCSEFKLSKTSVILGGGYQFNGFNMVRNGEITLYKYSPTQGVIARMGIKTMLKPQKKYFSMEYIYKNNQTEIYELPNGSAGQSSTIWYNVRDKRQIHILCGRLGWERKVRNDVTLDFGFGTGLLFKQVTRKYITSPQPDENDTYMLPYFEFSFKIYFDIFNFK